MEQDTPGGEDSVCGGGQMISARACMQPREHQRLN